MPQGMRVGFRRPGDSRQPPTQSEGREILISDNMLSLFEQLPSILISFHYVQEAPFPYTGKTLPKALGRTQVTCDSCLLDRRAFWPGLGLRGQARRGGGTATWLVRLCIFVSKCTGRSVPV